jgi:hypothetical protein
MAALSVSGFLPTDSRSSDFRTLRLRTTDWFAKARLSPQCLCFSKAASSILQTLDELSDLFVERPINV